MKSLEESIVIAMDGVDTEILPCEVSLQPEFDLSNIILHKLNG